MNSSATTSRSTSAKSKTPDHLLDMQLIQNWNNLKNQLQKSMGISKLSHKEIEALKNQPNQSSITLSHGFQSIRNMEHQRAELKLALYVPNSSSFITIDNDFVHVWKSGIHIQKYSLAPPAKETKKKIVSGLWNASKWLYIEQFHIYVVANHQLQVKVLDLHFDCLFTFSNPKPVLAIEYSKTHNSIICGEIGSIRVFEITKAESFHRTIYILKEVLEISEGLDDEWVTAIHYDRTKNRIFAGCGTNVFVYDYSSGKLLDQYHNIHSLSITCIIYYETAEYLITGCKDGSIKVWNAHKSQLYDLHEHYNAITGFMLMEQICELERGTFPLLISSSLDGTIRMWNFETGQGLYRVSTGEPCLGIGSVKKNHFYHFTCAAVQLWNVNRYQHTFSLVRSRPGTLERFDHPLKPARIVTTLADGSIRLVSPVTGTIISTGFPTKKDLQVLHTCYDMENEHLYCLYMDGSIIKYGTDWNPFVVDTVWDNSMDLNREVINCITGIELYQLDRGLIPTGISQKYLLLGGTASGQIHLIHFDKKPQQEFLIQAHGTPIKELCFNAKESILISSTNDGTIKFWHVGITKKSTGLQTIGKQSSIWVELKCLHIIQCEVPDGNFIFRACRTTRTVAFTNNQGLNLYDYFGVQSYTQERKEIIKTLQLVCSLDGKLWASTHDDHTVKVYDHTGILIREIQFNGPISCVSFANKRGDLLVGLADQLSLVKIQDFLPANILRSMLLEEYSDDELEPSMEFEDKEELVQTVQLPKNVIIRPDDTKLDVLLALSRIRTEEAKLRKNKRQFLVSERTTYDLEVALKKKREEIKRLSEERQRKEQEMVAAQLEALQQEQEHLKLLGLEVETELPEIMPDLIEMNQNATPQEFQESLALMDRFSEQEQKQRSVQVDDEDDEEEPFVLQKMISLPRLSVTQTVEEAKNEKTKSNESVNKKHTQFTTLEEASKGSLSKLAPMTLNDIESTKKRSKATRKRHYTKKKSKLNVIAKKKDEKISLLLDHFDEDTSPILEQEPMVDEMVINITEEEEKERQAELRQELLHLSAEQYQKDLKELKLIEEQKDVKQEKSTEKPRYTPGIELPNSAALPEILPMRFGNSVLNRNDMLFQTDDLSGMYRRASKQHLEVPKPPQRRFVKRTNTNVPKDLEEDLDYIPNLDGEIEEEFVKVVPVEQKTIIVPIADYSRPTIEQEHSETENMADLMENYRKEVEMSKPKKKKKKETEPKVKAKPLPKMLQLVEQLKKRKKEAEEEDARPTVLKDKPAVPTIPLGDKVTQKILRTHGLDSKIETKVEDIPGKKNIVGEVLNFKIHEKEKPPVPKVPKLKERKPSKSISPTPVVPKATQSVKIKEPSIPERTVRIPQMPRKQVKKESYHFESSNLAPPILKVLRESAPKIEGPVTIEKISNALNDVLLSNNHVKVKDASVAIVSLYKMFEYDLTTTNKFDMFIAPFLDAYENDNTAIRLAILQSVILLGIKHDNVLLLLVTALADHEADIRQAAIQGLAHFGITDKEGLKRAMIELDMIKGKSYKCSNQVIQQISIEKEKEFQEFLKRNDKMVGQWLSKTPNPPPELKLERKDSYLEHLAGRFFPPDAHDFEAKQRAKALMIEAVQNYDDYWKEHYLPKEDPEEMNYVIHGSIAEWETHEVLVPPTIQRIIPRPRPMTTVPRKRPQTSIPKRQTSANIAMRLTRALAATPTGMNQPKLNRPFTAVSKPNTRLSRPFTAMS